MGNVEDSINRCLSLFGVELKRTRNNPSLQTLLRRFFRQHQVDCVFDVGANIGGYGEFLRSGVGYRGLIISFEPVSAVYQTLHERAARDRLWVTHPMALGAENGTLPIHITKVSTFSSFLTPSHEAVSGFAGQNEVQRDEAVPVRRLDSLYPQLQSEHGFRRPFLKMDTQGFDREVLTGAQGVLPQLIGLQSEVCFLPLYRQMPGIADMFPLVAGLGFDVMGMYPVNRAPQEQWIEADTVFLRRGAVAPPG
jgi:FkbM family methyltransferase